MFHWRIRYNVIDTIIMLSLITKKNIRQTMIIYGQLVRKEERFVWEKHSTGFASKMLSKMGYEGKGLGKAENGIMEPITINPCGFAAADKQKSPESGTSKLIYILSDSMLNQMDGTRLSKKYVTVDCRGGCTSKGMYTRISSIIALKPDYILLHVGTNDCTNKTSDGVLRELECLLDSLERYCHAHKLLFLNL